VLAQPWQQGTQRVAFRTHRGLGQRGAGGVHMRAAGKLGWLGLAAVYDHHVVAPGQQLARDPPADEQGAAEDEDPHAATGPARPRAALPGRPGRRQRSSSSSVASKVKTCGPICKLQPGGSGLGSVPIRVHCSPPGGLK